MRLTSIEEARNEIKIIERKVDAILKINKDYDKAISEHVKLDLFTNASALIWVTREEITPLLEKMDTIRKRLDIQDEISYLENITDDNEYYKGRDAYRTS